jgi:hypothetical protein
MKGLIWWENIINAKIFIDSVVDAVSKHESVVMCLPKDIPWEATMREILMSRIREVAHDKSITEIFDIGEPVANHLFKACCKEDLRIMHRGSVHYAEFMAQKEESTIHSKIIWAKNVAEDNVSEWVDFMSIYNQKLAKHISPGIIIAEVRGCDLTFTGSKNVRYISYDDMVSDYDVYSFATLLAAEAKCKYYLRQYLADMTAQVCGNDVELVAECIVRWEDFLKNPRDTLNKIYKKARRSNGTSFEQEFSNDDINRRIWRAQVRHIFPELENYRIDFIEKHIDDIQRLDIGDEPVELGNLYYYVRHRQINVSTEEKDELKVYYDGRNKLAHLTNISFKDIQTILGK